MSMVRIIPREHCLKPLNKAADPSSLTRFRDGVGEERLANIFNQVVESARGEGLVSDCLPIVDSADEV